MNTFTKPLTQRITASPQKFNVNRRVIHNIIEERLVITL